MNQKLFVGNLPHAATEDYIRELFEESGYAVDQVMIVKDKETGRTRGFAFVTLADDVDARRAMVAMNGQSFMGRFLTVNEASPKPVPNLRRS